MLKFLSTLVLSVVLSVSSIVYLLHSTPKATQDFSQLRAASHPLTGTIVDDMSIFYGPIDYSCSSVTIAEGKVLTAGHCASPMATNIKVAGEPASVLKYDEEHDFALLSVPNAHCPCVEAGGEVVVGDPVVTVGYPYGNDVGFVQVLSKGTILGQMFDTIHKEIKSYYLIDVPVEGGNSGGGMFIYKDGQWKVFSVISRKAGYIAIAPSYTMLQTFLKGN